MPNATLVSDVRSILRRSLPDNTYSEYSGPVAIDQAGPLLHSLQAATALSQILPGVPLILFSVPTASSLPPEAMPSTAVVSIGNRPEALAATLREALGGDWTDSVPEAIEELLRELSAIERLDREYYRADNVNPDAMAAYQYRQRLRSDILEEILDLRRSMQNRG